MDERITADLNAKREWLCRLLAEARAGKRGMGDSLGQKGCDRLAISIQTAIDSIDDALRIISDAHRA